MNVLANQKKRFDVSCHCYKHTKKRKHPVQQLLSTSPYIQKESKT